MILVKAGIQDDWQYDQLINDGQMLSKGSL